jgi:hypothetical protein
LYEDAFVELRRIGDRRCSASTDRNLAVIAHQRGDFGRSTELFVEAVRLRHELGDHAGLAECFEGIAANLAAVDRPADAAVALAAAAARRRHSGTVASPDECARTAAVDAAIRSAVPPAQHALATARGEGLSVDQAVEFVMSLEAATSPGSTR